MSGSDLDEGGIGVWLELIRGGMDVWARRTLEALGPERARAALGRRAPIVLGEEGRRADFSHDVALHLACSLKGNENCPFVG